MIDTGKQRICSIDGCSDKHRSNGLCKKHADIEYRKRNRDAYLAKSKAYYQNNKDRFAEYASKQSSEKSEYMKKWRNKNKNYVTEYNAAYHSRNRSLMSDRNKTYYAENRDVVITQKLEYRRKHPYEHRATEARRRASLRQATPIWADNCSIKDIYIEAEYFQMEVDHIVPLKSKFVCGLHVEHNLQLLTKSQNAKKSNRVWPDMPETENVN